MLAVIAGAELAIEVCFGCDQPIEISKIFITQSTKAARDRFRIRDFGANQPERVNERRTDKLFPLLTQIPKSKFIRVFLPEANGLITDEKLRATDQT